ncbi:MAG: O-antigen ligase family protein [Lachnospiraceae bacterium]|nr:O-antigen ligase family protein [Lachnospiraceae bacterium]
MSKKKRAKKELELDALTVIRFLLGVLVSTYCCVLFFVMPIIYHDKYYDIGSFKYTMFMAITVSFLLFAVILLCIYLLALILKKKINKASITEFLSSFSVIDMFVLAFVIASMLSFIFSPSRTNEFPRFFLFDMKAPESVVNLPWEGYKDWNMGLRSQLMFASIYFLVTRFALKSWKKDMLFVMLVSSSIAFIFGVLHRFNIDPLELYENLEMKYKKDFLSTLGQSTWYSSYMILLVPIGISFFIYISRDNRLMRILFGIYCTISAATLVTQNSDSAYMACYAFFLIFLWVSFDNNERFLNFLDLMILMLSTAKVIGIFQLLFPERVTPLDKISFFITKSAATWVVLAALIAFRIFIGKKADGSGFEISKYNKVRNFIVFSALACIPIAILIVILNTKGYIPIEALKNNNYLYFDDLWGDARGVNWRNTVECLFEDPWKSRCLTGAGPDCLATILYATEPRATTLLDFFGGMVITCCHNEWLNMLVNEGILGFISYLGIFISAFTVFMKKSDHPVFTAGAACIAAYFFHNFFCYQQILCTPMIFCIIALCEWARRDPEICS